MNVSEEDMTPVAPQKKRNQELQRFVLRKQSCWHTTRLTWQTLRRSIGEVDQYIDAAILAGYPQVTIVHGKGTGALRTGITEFLKNHRSVKSYELRHKTKVVMVRLS